MKKIYITIMMVIAWSGIAMAQVDYTPLVQEGVRWTYLSSDVAYSFDENTGVESYLGKGDYAYFMEFRGDTIINGLTYKKLYSSLSREFDESKLRPVAYLRETDKHVYGIPDRTGRFQFAESHNLELPILGKAVFGSDKAWQEYELYDFNDMETFARETLSEFWGMNIDVSVTMTTVNINGEPRNAYRLFLFDDEYELFNFTIIEGIGNEDGNMLGFGPNFVPTCICPIELGLAQQETIDGNVIYHGKYYYGPYHGNQLIDVEDVNHAINIILGRQIYSRHYLDDISDFNGDYVIDVGDVNAIINRILKLDK